MGEYVDESTLSLDYGHRHKHLFETSDYSIRSNAMVLSQANPESMAKSVYFLIENEDIRNILSKNGVLTISKYFHISRQINQYRQLYSDLLLSRDRIIDIIM